MKAFFKQILMVNDPEKGGEDRFSLSRSLLLFASLLYFLCIFMLWIGLYVESLNIDKNIIDTAIEALRWPILTFAAYAFGGKVLKSQKR